LQNQTYRAQLVFLAMAAAGRFGHVSNNWLAKYTMHLKIVIMRKRSCGFLASTFTSASLVLRDFRNHIVRRRQRSVHMRGDDSFNVGHQTEHGVMAW